MSRTNVTLSIVGVILIVAAMAAAAYALYVKSPTAGEATPQPATVTGIYVCLHYVDPTLPRTGVCTVLGIKTADGVYYAIKIASSTSSTTVVQLGQNVTAEGTFVPKDKLTSKGWAKYEMIGLLTVTKITSQSPAVKGKLNIDVVCEQAVASMTFSDLKAITTFVAECKDGKHPEVIEKYKAQLGTSSGATI